MNESVDMRLVFGPIVWNNLDYLLYTGKLTKNTFEYYVRFFLEHFVVCEECKEHALKFLENIKDSTATNVLEDLVSLHNNATIQASKSWNMNPKIWNPESYMEHVLTKFTKHIIITNDNYNTPSESTCIS